MSYLEQFKQQWKDYLKDQLSAEGLKYREIGGGDKELIDNSMNYFNWLRRVPIAKPRSIRISGQFDLPEGYEEDFLNFCKVVEKGESLKNFGSRKNIKGKDKEIFRDSMFDDWGILHFHFKTTGTKEVIFAVVEPDTIYCLLVSAHGQDEPDVWFNKDLLEILHSDFPHLISHRKLGSSSPDNTTSQEDHKFARKYRCNLPIILNDGTQYFPTGGLAGNNGTIDDNATWQVLFKQIMDIADKAEKRSSYLLETLHIKDNHPPINLYFKYDEEQKIFLVR